MNHPLSRRQWLTSLLALFSSRFLPRSAAAAAPSQSPTFAGIINAQVGVFVCSEGQNVICDNLVISSPPSGIVLSST